MTDSETSPKILSVGDFFVSEEYKHLVKPDYQRPYEWTQKHVRTLLDDLCNFLHEPSLQYRLGCVILYANGDVLEIVDGQQRLVTLWLIRRFLRLGDKTGPDAIGNFSLNDDISRDSVQNACLAIKEWFNDHSVATNNITQLLAPAADNDPEMKKAELVFLRVDDREEAFQLFDSQNSRGKPLKVHNYLKARHLGCMSREEQSRAEAYGLFEGWMDAKDSDEMERLFNRLFKIGEWSRRRTRTQLTTDNMDRFFYGFSDAKFPYQKHYILNTGYFEIGRQFKAGEEFFWMVKHFRHLTRQIDEYCFYNKNNNKNKDNLQKPQGCLSDCYLRLLQWDQGSGWTTGQLWRNQELFYAAAIAYSNRFGLDSLRENAKTLFAWALALRFVFIRIRDETLDDFATGSWNDWGLLPLPVFERMAEAVTTDFLLDMKQMPLSVIGYNDKSHPSYAQGYKYQHLLDVMKKDLLGIKQDNVSGDKS